MTVTVSSQGSHGSPEAQLSGHRGKSAAGVGAGVAASLVWGTAYLVPVLLGGWSPVIVTLGRYLVYGLLSAVLFVLGGRAVRQLAREHWSIALAFAVAGNAGYYLLLVVGIRAAGAPLTDMVIGVIPVAVTVAGNVLVPAFGWRRLAMPLILVTTGIVLVSVLEISGVRAYSHGPAGEKAAGLIAACAAVVLWTWYALANARFLAGHHDITAAAWSTVVGVATAAVALAGLSAAAVTGQLAALGTVHSGTGRLIAGVIFLGVVVSWAGTWLWNLASSRLSPAVTGLLVNLETVTGFGYVYAARHQWPPAGQLAGLILVITGVALSAVKVRSWQWIRRGTPDDR